ncbi:MAG: hypothetical protein ACYTHM_18010 [Planctomycetota bacterium]|jgi:hypothetical protein
MFQPQFHLIESEVLGEKILLVDRDANRKNAVDLYPECVIYTHAEIGKLYGIPDESLKAVHEIKKCLRGSVSRVSEPVQ